MIVHRIGGALIGAITAATLAASAGAEELRIGFLTTLTGGVYDSGDYAKSLDMARERIDVGAVRTRQAVADAGSGPRKRIGVGFALVTEHVMLGGEHDRRGQAREAGGAQR